MCEIIQLPIENINYRFLYFRANDKNRPIFEVWANTEKELFNICLILNKIKHAKINYALISKVKNNFNLCPALILDKKIINFMLILLLH